MGSFRAVPPLCMLFSSWRGDDLEGLKSAREGTQARQDTDRGDLKIDIYRTSRSSGLRVAGASSNAFQMMR